MRIRYVRVWKPLQSAEIQKNLISRFLIERQRSLDKMFPQNIIIATDISPLGMSIKKVSIGTITHKRSGYGKPTSLKKHIEKRLIPARYPHLIANL